MVNILLDIPSRLGEMIKNESPKSGHENRSAVMTAAYVRIMGENAARVRFNFASRLDNTGNIFVQLRDDDGTVMETYELGPGGSFGRTSEQGQGVWAKEFWAKGSIGTELLDCEEG